MTAASSLPPSRNGSSTGHANIASPTIGKAHEKARKRRAGMTRYTEGTGEIPGRRQMRTMAEQIAAE